MSILEDIQKYLPEQKPVKRKPRARKITEAKFKEVLSDILEAMKDGISDADITKKFKITKAQLNTAKEQLK